MHYIAVKSASLRMSQTLGILCLRAFLCVPNARFYWPFSVLLANKDLYVYNLLLAREERIDTAYR